MARLLSVLVVLSVAVSVYCDVYMHNPRGNNDRLNEASDRQNANRLFRSENNAAGGYCWGPSLSYYAGSMLSIEWTNQHGCGNPNLNCNLVIQYMCGDNNGDINSIVRDGTTTGTITTSETDSQRQDASGNYVFGMNENYYYYANCTNRQRNKGLFTADQNMNNGQGAMATRQENNGQRFGFECGEEAVYYPYWHPSPWKDIVVFTNDKTMCKYYKANSQNVLAKNYCSGTKAQQAFNNENDCKSNGGTWKSQDSWNLDAPDCQPAPYNRDNHLGNGVTGYTNSYNWTLPTAKVEPCITADSCACVLRLRYNVSTAEIAWNLDSTSNGANSPVTGDPYVLVAGNNLSLALNTNQYGRTFQDRSYVFKISPRPQGVSDSATIWNLNIRGKRGNIVQAYPAVEYDFTPENLALTIGDYIHFQWTGCDTNPAGQAGEGTDQTDRSNIVQMTSLAANKPMSDAEMQGGSVKKLFDNDDDRLGMSYLGQSGCLDYSEIAGGNQDANVQNCAKLNAASPYYNGGLMRMNSTGTFFYMSTRNNNFSNRTQKGSIMVKPLLPAYAIALIVVGGVVGVGAAATAGTVAYAKKNPSSGAASFVAKIPGLNRI